MDEQSLYLFIESSCKPMFLCRLFPRATEQATPTAARHCETKLKSIVTRRSLPPPTGVTHTARTVTQVLAPR